MAQTSAVKKSACDYITGLGNKVSLHTADPGTTGASEVSGGSYAKQATTWGASVDGSGGDAGKAVSTGSDVTFTIPASTTVAYFGVWNAAGSTFLWGAALTPSVTINANGPGQVTVTPRAKHGDG